MKLTQSFDQLSGTGIAVGMRDKFTVRAWWISAQRNDVPHTCFPISICNVGNFAL
jgi:hypothetical protein